MNILLLVPKAGLEPAQLSLLPPQGSVSTNSTTSAQLNFTINYFFCPVYLDCLTHLEDLD